MDIFSKCTESSLRNIFCELEAFRRQSGFTVSYEKTTLYRIGSMRTSNAQLYGIDQVAWSNEDINVLGVTITHDQLVEKNYQTVIQKVKKVLGAWQNRGLSLIGKVQVINTLVASLFVYKMMVLPIIPPNIVKAVESQFREFLWNGKKAKIALNILQNPKSQGGLNLVHLLNRDKALKATWPQILDQEPEYAQIVYSILRCKSMKGNIWRCSLAPQDVHKLKIRNVFWEDVLKSWCEYNYYSDRRVENEIIWYNSRMQTGGKTFLLERLF